VYKTQPQKIAETIRQIEEKGGSAVPFVANLGTKEVSETLVDETGAKLGGIDILVNNNGTNRRKQAIDVPEDDCKTPMAINLESIFWLCQAACPRLYKSDCSKVKNTGSMMTLTGIGGMPVYGMTKAAIGQLTKTLALEWAKDNIQVNCIAPGFFRTPLTEAGFFSDPKKVKFLDQRIPMKRGAPPLY